MQISISISQKFGMLDTAVVSTTNFVEEFGLLEIEAAFIIFESMFSFCAF